MTSGFDEDELLSLQSPSGRKAPPVQALAAPQPPKPSRPPRGGDLASEAKAEQRIGQYIIKRTLGEGSFGKVKLAVHRVSGQEVALKIISRRKLVSRDMAGRVEREISYLQLLRHPHIIKLYTVITTPNEIIMVIEYAGGELFDYLVKYGKLAEGMARRFFQQIVCAVEYCHRHKIVHRDLKPENLLLDSNLNVKIADFGLSNIMTDGNFLKTSCGSPNYAAPEVISGKLYAGPEVDVWSCGIILYVLLVGKLPFDDDFIPALFRKINSGNYHTPSWLGSGPTNLIAKMLKVNPVNRISIQEIRQDPWFNEDLEDYLKPPVEEFLDTGVDPNKPIDPTNLAPGKPPDVQRVIHNQVLDKLGRTMGYAKGDVQEALTKNEPNAIKDAYLIVRENQIMRDIPSLTTKENMQPFMAYSPPTWDHDGVGSPMNMMGSLTGAQHSGSVASPLPPSEARPTPPPAAEMETGSAAHPETKDTYVSGISILASSLPHYHNMFLEQQKKERERRSHSSQHSQFSEVEDLEPHEVQKLGQAPFNSDEWRERSHEEQEQMSRALKPHSRSTLQLQRITSQPPELEQEPAKIEKKRNPRWQFGIRSRSVPHEAMHCVYKALVALGAEWEIPEPVEDSPSDTPRSYPVNIRGGMRLEQPMTHSPRSESPEYDRTSHREPSHREPSHEYFTHKKHAFTEMKDGKAKRWVPNPDKDGFETDDEDIDPAVVPDNYVPKDPWCIRVRWRKDGMYPPSTTVHPASAHSSRADLNSISGLALGETSASDMPSLTASSSATSVSPAASMAGTASNSSGTAHLPPPQGPSAEGSCYVYMDVQLYSIEPGVDRQSVYLVDFKCAGYETLVEKVMGDSEKLLVGSGYRVKDKDVTSPQPFLDLANRLVIQLASGSSG